jgi:mRNA interferase MazF
LSNYIPKKGDFITVTFDPRSGHEQQGRRPALVISNTLFNKHTDLAIVCPITNTYLNFPFHVEIPDQSSLTGYIMVEQVKSIDFVSRKVKFVEKAPLIILNEVLGILDACIYESS